MNLLQIFVYNNANVMLMFEYVPLDKFCSFFCSLSYSQSVSLPVPRSVRVSSVRPFASQSVSQTVSSSSVSQSVSTSSVRRDRQSVSQSDSQFVFNQSVNQSISQSVQSVCVGRSFRRPVSLSFNLVNLSLSVCW